MANFVFQIKLVRVSLTEILQRREVTKNLKQNFETSETYSAPYQTAKLMYRISRTLLSEG